MTLYTNYIIRSSAFTLAWPFPNQSKQQQKHNHSCYYSSYYRAYKFNCVCNNKPHTKSQVSPKNNEIKCKLKIFYQIQLIISMLKSEKEDLGVTCSLLIQCRGLQEYCACTADISMAYHLFQLQLAQEFFVQGLQIHQKDSILWAGI